jgi:hypothetical protein
MILTCLAGATPRLLDADRRLAAALATIRRARGTERPSSLGSARTSAPGVRCSA